MNKDMNWKLRKAFTGNNTSDVQTINGYIAAGEDNDFAVEVSPDGKEYAAPLFIPRTNLLLQSNQFDTTWTLQGSTLASEQTDKDGGTSAWKLTSLNTSQSFVKQIVSSSGVATSSVYAKAGTANFIVIYAVGGGDPRTFFDLINGTTKTEGFNITNKIEAVGNGWFRCSVIFDKTISDVRLFIADSDNNFNSGIVSSIYIQDAQLEAGTVATEYIPTTTAAVTRDWSAFGRVQNQLPGICNGTHTHTGAASGGGIAATTLTGTGSGGKFKYEFDTLGKLVLIEATDAGQGYRVDDKLSITTNEGHDIEFRLVEGSNAATVSVSMDATRPNKPIPFPVSKMRVEGLTDRRVLIMDQRSRYVFPKPTPYLLDSYEGAAAAYSLRRLRSAYTGPAVRVRRESNNDELDIYFDGQGNLDTASLEAFCAGTNGFVKVWYDQGQGGNDATQTTTAAQPQIVSSGLVVTENGLPTLQFTDSTFEVGSTDLYGQTDFDAYIAYATSDTSYILFGDSTVGGKFSYVISTETVTALQSGYNETSLYVNGAEVLINASTTTRQDLYNACVLGTMTLEVHQGHTTSLWTDFKISAYSGRQLTGNVSEIILYNSDQSANRQGIEDNINDYYNIY